MIPRLTYNEDKVTAEVARKIENGDAGQEAKAMTLQEASWMITKGDGMGKRIYR